MRRFVDLCAQLAASPDSAPLITYFRTAPKPDRVWAAALLSARRPKRVASLTELQTWAIETTNLPPWLFDDCQTVSGDLAETVALILPPPTTETNYSLTEVMAQLTSLSGQSDKTRRSAIQNAWCHLPPSDRMIYNKLATGGFRLEVRRGLLTRALAHATGGDEGLIAHRLMANWDPKTTEFEFLTPTPSGANLTPHPFAQARPLGGATEMLGAPVDWHAEWQWDGIRAQIITRPNTYALWAQGPELITDRFPEFEILSNTLPANTVLDGWAIAWRDHFPLPASALNNRLTYKKLTPKNLSEAPASFMAYDLLEEAGKDLRAQPFSLRRARLTALLSALPDGIPITLSPQIDFSDWQALATACKTARDRGAEGVTVLPSNSPYPGDWRIWKPDPYSIQTVLIYAQSRQGSAPALFTFAVKQGNELIPIAKTVAGLTAAEIQQITEWVKANTVERFGPVRSVPPRLVFEITFDGIQISPRRKSGLTLQNPRIGYWHHHKTVDAVDSITTLHGLLLPSDH